MNEIMSTATVDLATAIDCYNRALVDRLRGFAAGADVAAFLERWVHDDEPVNSLNSLVEAAAERGLQLVELVVSNQLLEWIDQEALDQQFGDALTWGGDARGVLLSIAILPAMSRIRRRGDTRSVPMVRRAASQQVSMTQLPLADRYVRALDQRLDAVSTGAHTEAAWCSVAERGGVRWAVGVSSSGALVASEVTGKGDLARLARCTASLLVGLNLRELRDHGVAHTELALRGRSTAGGAPGIFLPRQGGTLFGELQDLLDELWRRWTLDQGNPLGLNEWDRQPSAEWLGLSERAQRDRLQSVVDRTVVGLGLSANAVPVLGMDQGFLVLCAHPPVDGSGPKGGVLMAIERALRDSIDPALVVTTEERKDGNKLRRLTVAGEVRE